MLLASLSHQFYTHFLGFVLAYLSVLNIFLLNNIVYKIIRAENYIQGEGLQHKPKFCIFLKCGVALLVSHDTKQQFSFRANFLEVIAQVFA